MASIDDAAVVLSHNEDTNPPQAKTRKLQGAAFRIKFRSEWKKEFNFIKTFLGIPTGVCIAVLIYL